VSLLPLLAQLAIAVSAPDTVGVLDPIVVTIEMSAPSSRAPQLVAPDFGDFDVTRSNVSHYTQHDGVASRVRVEIRYVLEAPGAGDYRLPPFEARLGGETARSRPLRIVVRGPAGLAIPPLVTRGIFDASSPVSVSAAVAPDTVYVGEQTTYQVAVFIEEAVRNRLRRNPGFTPPELRGMLAYDLSPLRSNLPPRRVRDRRYEPHLYQRAVFPLVAGRHVIPPAELRYSLPLSYSFFSREENHVLRTDSLVLYVRELPAVDRPSDWLGAVGEYTMAARLDTTSARVGDPAVLTVRVTGTGNIKMLPRPAITVPWGALVPADERVTIDPEAERIGGTKEFDWVLTPRHEGPQELPALRFPFFNPRTEQYEIALSRADTVTVAAGTLVATESADSAPAPLLPLRDELRGGPAVPLHRTRGFLILIAAAPLPALLAAFIRRPRRRRVPTPPMVLRSLARERRARAPADVRRAYVSALAHRLHLPPGTLATRADFARALRRAGVSRETTESAAILLADLDGAAYGLRAPYVARLVDRAQASYHAVDAEARIIAPGPVTSASLSLLVGAALATAAGAQPPADSSELRALFTRGTAQYQARDFAAATLTFGRLTELAPDAPDAWANLGTAAWAAKDTATAVVGWQRALRLEPLAGDVRTRLRQVGPARIDSPAWVPPIPLRGLTTVIAALWILACSVALWRAVGRRPVGVRATIVPAMSALVLAGCAILLDERLAARSLVVVGEPTPLRDLPALAGRSVATLHAGDVARTIHRRGEWTLVRTERGREGWVEAPVLISLARD
jgi:hypothetical protein